MGMALSVHAGVLYSKSPLKGMFLIILKTGEFPHA